MLPRSELFHRRSPEERKAFSKFFLLSHVGGKARKRGKCKPVYDVPILCFYLLSRVHHIMYISGGEFFSFSRRGKSRFWKISLSKYSPRSIYALFFIASGIFMCACFTIFNGNLYLMLPGKKDYFSSFCPLSTMFLNSASRAKLNYFVKEWSGRKEAKSGNCYITKLNDGDILHTILCFRNFKSDEMVDEDEALIRST